MTSFVPAEVATTSGLPLSVSGIDLRFGSLVKLAPVPHTRDKPFMGFHRSVLPELLRTNK
jgi:hypothetical protein